MGHLSGLELWTPHFCFAISGFPSIVSVIECQMPTHMIFTHRSYTRPMSTPGHLQPRLIDKTLWRRHR
ncbi:hypothetical protein K443DRAFT_252704 [Laccaria amethystina LaAM-08-1]|uniref:Uncharacterized protein n=1 Tax=Laccaria amethystina LaAM-08-1 TaxID=1095629 RepID=A0A0C9YFF7_9AGAR|nr:hypothetical protein K443DRAFT_252704 [Laccaria amethystina LaAM-08-1]